MLTQLKEFSPDIVGLTATTPLINDAYHTISLIKKMWGNKLQTVLGGCHATALPQESMQDCPEIDVVCTGEGEEVLLDMANKKPLNSIKGIIYRLDNNLIQNKKRPLIENIDNLPYPAWHLLDKDFYFSKNSTLIRGFMLKGTTIITTRGCPYKCSFCQSSTLLKANPGKSVRFHSVERVISEIEYLIDKYQIEGLVFNDDMFSLQRKRVLDICNQLIKKGINKKLKFAINLRVDSVDEELLKVLKEAGCVRVIYGCESGSEKTLKNMNKKTSVKKNIHAIQLSKKNKITCEANIIIGLPGETRADFLNTIQFLKKARPDRINRGKLYPIPATKYYNDLVANNVIKRPKNWNDLNDKYVATDFTFADISKIDFRKLKDKMDREVVLPANYLFNIKTNIKQHKAYAFKQFIIMLIHCVILCLPIRVRNFMKNIAEKLQVKSKYVFE